jgi:hypothetical protein
MSLSIDYFYRCENGKKKKRKKDSKLIRGKIVCHQIIPDSFSWKNPDLHLEKRSVWPEDAFEHCFSGQYLKLANSALSTCQSQRNTFFFK